MEESNLNKSNKPDWLRALESQSWQAELIASGLAIYGSISFGPFLVSAVETTIPMFNDRVLEKLQFAVLYLFLAQNFMVASFIGHLILRIIWAGFLGLSSVYPQGIKVDEDTQYPLYFLKQLKEEFVDLSEHSIKLDNYCSIIFSILCTVVIFLLSFFFWICIAIAISELLNSYLPPSAVDWIGYAVLFLILAFSLWLSLLTTGPLKQSGFAKRQGYALYRVYSMALLLFGYQTVSYLMWTIRTHSSMKRFMTGTLVLLLPVSFLTGVISGKVLDHFSPAAYFLLNAEPRDANYDNYLEHLKSSRILRPVIPSREIETPFLKVFIPDMKRDGFYRELMCGKISVDKEADRKTRNRQKLEAKIRCSEQYFQFSIGEQAFENVKFNWIRHEHNNERGFLVYLPLEEVMPGEHLLKIKTGYQNRSGESATRVIPFYKM